MIDTTNPEIDVDTLMRRIRREVARHKGQDNRVMAHEVGSKSTLPDYPSVTLQPTFQQKPDRIYELADLLCFHGERFVDIAYRAILLRVPDQAGLKNYLNRLRRGESKISILGSLRYSREGRSVGVKVKGLLPRFILQRIYRLPLVGRLVQIGPAILRLPDIVRDHRALEAHVITLLEQVERAGKERYHNFQIGFQEKFDILIQQKADQTSVEAALKQKADQGSVEAALKQKADQTSVEAALKQKADQSSVEAVLKQKADQSNVEAALKQKADQSNVEAALKQKADQSNVEAALKQKADQSNVEAALKQKADQTSVEAALKRLYDLKRNLLDQERRLMLLLEEARKRLPALINQEQIEAMLSEEDHVLDAMYATFEDQFRGTREDIKSRQAVYLPITHKVNAGTEAAPVIDLGCGRGEWLELLRDTGLCAKGIDINRIFLTECRQLGFEVIEQDALTFLREQKPNSIGAISGFHIIEHLPLKYLIALFDESFRVLTPGGVVIFETPNPGNIQVGSCNFYLDPTHRNPLPAPLSQYLLEARGFVNSELLYLHPYDESVQLREGDTHLQHTLNQFFFGPQDYAVISFKP